MMNPYQSQGADGVPMIGRRTWMEKLKRHLLRESPLHVSLIGPTQIGKSVILRALATAIRDVPGNFEAVVYWNLSHGTPNNDGEFFSQLHDRIKSEALAPDLKDWLDSSRPREALSDFFDDIKSQGKVLLVILDSLDSPLAKGTLSANTLDWMRSLSDAGTAVFVMGSRTTLHELCRSEETQSSPFWNIFNDPPEELGPWDSSEWGEIFAPIREAGKTVHPVAEAALQEWTNGIPALTTLVLSRLFDLPSGTEIHARDVVLLCEEIADSEAQILKQLWNDCDPDWQGDLVELSSRNIAANAIPPESLKGLRKRGFVRKSGGDVVACCKFLTQFARQSGSQVEHLNRLFSGTVDYRKNISSVLAKRLAQIAGADPKLVSYIRHALVGLESDPETTVQGIRGISSRALTLVFEAECPSNQIEISWVTSWQHDGQSLARQQDIVDRRVPRSPHLQRELLLLMTGDRKSNRVARFVSKPTALLTDFIQSAGDFGQHIENNEVCFEFAVTVCAAAIELCDHLARELRPAD